LAALVLLAFLLRLAWGIWTAPVPPPFSDDEYYDATARSLAAGDGYSALFTPDGFRPGGNPTAFYPPGYSIALAGAFKAFGPSFSTARSANALFGALTVVPAYAIARRLAHGRAAITAAVVVALMPSLVAWTPVLLSETLFTLIFTAAVAILITAGGNEREVRTSRLILFGVVLGLASLVRGQALILLPVALAWWAWKGLSLKKAGLMSAAAAAAASAVLLPWAVRSSLALDAPVLLSTNFGYNLRVGHAPYATGRYVTPQDLWDEPARDFRALEVVFNQAGTRRAIDYAAGHPFDEAKLTLKKAWYLWRPDTDALTWVESYGLTPLPRRTAGPLRWLIGGTYVALALLALAGLARLGRRSPEARLVALTALAWTAVDVVFFGEPRYHLPLLPLLSAVTMAAWPGRLPA